MLAPSPLQLPGGCFPGRLFPQGSLTWAQPKGAGDFVAPPKSVFGRAAAAAEPEPEVDSAAAAGEDEAAYEVRNVALVTRLADCAAEVGPILGQNRATVQQALAGGARWVLACGSRQQQHVCLFVLSVTSPAG
eukprot:SAG22_NODE_3750_length_1546_cov_1.650311_3_plen_133_part_00